MGLGADSGWWPPRFLEALQMDFMVVVFDNRGAGRSDKPDVEYSIEGMALDTIGLMDHLGLERASVLGVSMGGMIAQEMAISHPERVRKLVLVTTGPGGPCSVPPRPEALEQLLLDRSTTPPEVIAEKTIETLFPREWLEAHRGEVEAMARRILENPMPGHAYRRQLEAVMRFESCNRLHLIRAPTLVVGGGRDIILPVENSKVLAERIPNARLVIYSDAGHGLVLQKQDELAGLVRDFLKEDP